jgi:hypothetical protein
MYSCLTLGFTYWHYLILRLLTQFCLYHTISGTNIVINMYMACVRENVVVVDVEKTDICARVRLT